MRERRAAAHAARSALSPQVTGAPDTNLMDARLQRLKLEGTPRTKRERRTAAPPEPLPASSDFSALTLSSLNGGFDIGSLAQKMMMTIFDSPGMEGAIGAGTESPVDADAAAAAGFPQIVLEEGGDDLPTQDGGDAEDADALSPLSIGTSEPPSPTGTAREVDLSDGESDEAEGGGEATEGEAAPSVAEEEGTTTEAAEREGGSSEGDDDAFADAEGDEERDDDDPDAEGEGAEGAPEADEEDFSGDESIVDALIARS